MKSTYFKIFMLILGMVLGARDLYFSTQQNNSSSMASEVTNVQFLEAIKSLDSEFAADKRVAEALIDMEADISQISIHEDEDYVLTWYNFGFTSAYIVFLKEDSSCTPIYLSKPGRDIKGVSLLDLGIGSKFIEIISYFGTGGHSAEKATLLMLSKGQATNVWEYETMSVDAGRDLHQRYSTYKIVSYPFDKPQIRVHSIYTLNEDAPTESDTVFEWDETQKMFVEKL